MDPYIIAQVAHNDMMTIFRVKLHVADDLTACTTLMAELTDAFCEKPSTSVNVTYARINEFDWHAFVNGLMARVQHQVPLDFSNFDPFLLETVTNKGDTMFNGTEHCPTEIKCIRSRGTTMPPFVHVTVKGGGEAVLSTTKTCSVGVLHSIVCDAVAEFNRRVQCDLEEGDDNYELDESEEEEEEESEVQLSESESEVVSESAEHKKTKKRKAAE